MKVIKLKDDPVALQVLTGKWIRIHDYQWNITEQCWEIAYEEGIKYSNPHAN